MYIIVDCPYCRKLMIKLYGRRRVECVYCGRRFTINPDKYIKFHTLHEATVALWRLRGCID